MPSVSLLRNLFFPQSRFLLVPTLQARCVVKNGTTSYKINGLLKNAGSASAFDTFVLTHFSPTGASYQVKDWQTGPILNPCHSHAEIPIHPAITTHFFATGYDAKNLAGEPTFRIQIFARDAEPLEWLISFTVSEMQAGAEKKGARRSLFFPT